MTLTLYTMPSTIIFALHFTLQSLRARGWASGCLWQILTLWQGRCDVWLINRQQAGPELASPNISDGIKKNDTW